VTLIARSASAYLISGDDQVGVYWPFRGTVTALSLPSDAACCDPNIALGDTVFGAVQMISSVNYPAARSASATFQLPEGGTVGAGSCCEVTVRNGTPPPPGFPPGDPDSFAAGSGQFGGTTALIDFRPGWHFDTGTSVFARVDVHGVAWSTINPRTGEYLPDYAPPASLFETAEITIYGSVINESSEFEGFGVVVHIDEFQDPRPVPEPQLALLALKSSAAAVRRSGRAAARASSAAGASPG
jgi:hypothetical protein